MIRHFWNDTPHTCNLFSWYLYWYLMSVVKQWLQLHSILSCMYHTVVWVPSYRVFNLSGILLVKSVKIVVIMWFFFILFILTTLKNIYMQGNLFIWIGFQNGLFLILDLSNTKDGGYMYIYYCELITHTSSKVIRWNFYAADDTAFDNRFVQLLYFSLLVLLKWPLQYLQSVCFFFLTKQFCYFYKL